MTNPEQPPAGETIIDLNEKLPTRSRQSGMIAHERGLVRYRGPEIHAHGTVYRVNIPTFVAVLADLLAGMLPPDENGQPDEDTRAGRLTPDVRDAVMAAAVARYGPDTNVEAFIPEPGMLTAMWVLGLHRDGVAADRYLHSRDGMIDTTIPTTATGNVG